MNFQLGFISHSLQEDAALASWPKRFRIRISCFILSLRIRFLQC